MKIINGTKLFDRKEVMEMLGCSSTTISKYVKDGRLAFTRLGNKNYLSESQLNNYLNGK